MPFQTISPATGELVQSFPDIGDDALAATVHAAQAVHETDWRHRGIADRAAIVSLAAKRLRDNIKEYAGCVTLEMGKLTAEARAEVALSADILDYYAVRAVPGALRRRLDAERPYLIEIEIDPAVLAWI